MFSLSFSVGCGYILFQENQPNEGAVLQCGGGNVPRYTPYYYPCLCERNENLLLTVHLQITLDQLQLCKEGQSDDRFILSISIKLFYSRRCS